jgi:hypothetical protein
MIYKTVESSVLKNEWHIGFSVHVKSNVKLDSCDLRDIKF